MTATASGPIASSFSIWMDFFESLSLWAVLLPLIAGAIVALFKKDWVLGFVSALIGSAGLLIGFVIYLAIKKFTGVFAEIPTTSYLPGTHTSTILPGLPVFGSSGKPLTLNSKLFVTLGSVAASVFGSWIGFTAEEPAYQDENHIHGLKVARNTAKGTSRWAGKRDIRRIAAFGDPVPGRGGTVVGKLDDEVVRLMPDKTRPPLPQHAVVVAGTGAGKTYSFVLPNIIAAGEDGESLVLTDPKGELATTMGPWLKSKGYKIYIFNLAYPEWSMFWNPIMECKDDEEISQFAETLIKNAGSDRSGYFVSKEIQLVKAMTYLLKYAFPPEQAHLRSMLSLLAWPPEMLDELFMKAYTQGIELTDPHDPTRTFKSKMPQEGIEEWRGVLAANFDNAVSGVTSKLDSIRGGSIAQLLSKQEIDLSAVGKEKAALFAILPVASSNFKPILSTFYYFLFKRLYGLAQFHGGRLPKKTRFLLDEFANVGEIPGFTDIISTARSLGIKIQIVLQSVKQLNDTYGATAAETILSNCPIQLFLGGDDLSTTQYFSSRLGNGAVYATNERRDLSEPGKTYTESISKRHLMEPEELSRMDPMDAVCLVRWSFPLYLKKTDWTTLKQAKEVLATAAHNIAEVAPHRSKEETKLVLPNIPFENEEVYVPAPNNVASEQLQITFTPEKGTESESGQQVPDNVPLTNASSENAKNKRTREDDIIKKQLGI